VKDFTYLAPASVPEAVALLAEHKGKTKVLAGGTDLMLHLQDGVFTPDYVISVRGIPELNDLSYDSNWGLTIGAATPLRQVETSSAIRELYPHLAVSASEIGSVQIRNLGSFGGNICTATPSADGIPALISLDAVANIASVRGERQVPLGEFFTGVRKTVLEPDEILVSLTVPAPGPRTSGTYIKLDTRPQMDLAIVGVATTLSLAADLQTVAKVRIVLGAVAPTPIRAREAEEILTGHSLSDDLLARAGAAAAAAARPISDVRASAEYRREQCDILTQRAIRQTAARIRGN